MRAESPPAAAASAPPRSRAGTRVLFLIDEMEAITAGGTERQVLHMVRLARQAGFAPEIALLRGTGWLTEAIAGCPVRHWNLRSVTRPAGAAEAWRLMRWMRARKFAIVQTFFVEANILGPLLARWAGVPVIIGSRRNLNYWMTGTQSRLQSMSNRYATRLAANCERVREEVARREGVPAAKIDVIYNGIDVHAIGPDAALRTKTRAELGVADGVVIFGVVSALRHPKGVNAFIAAAAQVARQLPNALFVIVGDGPLRAELEQQAAAAGLRERVHFLGAQADVAGFLNAFDVAVLPSESEGFSNSILEYMAAALPVIATDVGGNAEALAATGVLVRARDSEALARAMLRLGHDSSLRSQLGAAARRRVESEFAMERLGERQAAYFDRLLAEART